MLILKIFSGVLMRPNSDVDCAAGWYSREGSVSKAQKSACDASRAPATYRPPHGGACCHRAIWPFWMDPACNCSLVWCVITNQLLLAYQCLKALAALLFNDMFPVVGVALFLRQGDSSHMSQRRSHLDLTKPSRCSVPYNLDNCQVRP